MELRQFVEKYKNKLFNMNIVIIILTLIIANNIYKQQDKKVASFKAKNALEIQKNKVLEDISKIEKIIASYRSLLVKKDAGEIINTLSSIAREAGIEITSIKPAQEERHTEYIKRSFNLQLKTSDYHGLGKFISKVESYRDVYIVDSLGMKTESATKELTINLKISSIAHSL